MSEVEPQLYLVRDPQGNVYGPADAATLRDWVGQGRIVAGMHIAPRETREWVEVSQHPALADLFGTATSGVADAPVVVPTEPTIITPQDVEVRPVAPGYGQAATSTTGFPGTPGIPDAMHDPNRIPTVPFGVPMVPQNKLGGASKTLGIISLSMTVIGCLCCFTLPLGALGGIASIVLGAVAMMQVGHNPEQVPARRQAVMGITLGAVSLVIAFGAIIFWTILSMKNGKP